MEGEQGAVECNRRGLEANSNGDSYTALQLFKHARHLNPSQPNYALSAANMYLKRGNPVPAIAIFEELYAPRRARTRRAAALPA